MEDSVASSALPVGGLYLPVGLPTGAFPDLGDSPRFFLPHDLVFWRIRRCGPVHVLAVAGSVIALVSLAAQANRLASAGEVFGGRGRRQRKNVSLRRLYYATGACHCHQAWWPLSSLLPLPVKVLPTSGRWARDSLSGRALSQQPVQAA